MLKRAASLAGLDEGVFFSLLSKSATICCAIVTLALVVTYLPPDRQGYYYTFTSLLVLQTFLELGMGTVLTQFLSHEWIKLRFDSARGLAGDDSALLRTGALVRIGLKWYACASAVFLLVVGSIGTLLLRRHGTPAGVIGPWWLLCCGVSISLIQIPLRAFLEGSNQVPWVQKLSAVLIICSSLAGWVALIAGLQLYAPAISAATTAVLGAILFGRSTAPFWRHGARTADAGLFSWKTEFWPQQWRIAVSWMSGFMMFYSFVPILFYYQGPIVAGQMGASLQIYTAVNAVASSWINAKGPQMGILGARGQIQELKELVHRALVRSTLAAITVAALALAFLFVLQVEHYKRERFIDSGSMMLLLFTVIVLQRSNVETLAIRFQKEEPFIINSVASACLVAVSNVLLSWRYSSFAVCLGFCIIAVGIMVPWIHRIYLSRIGYLLRSAQPGYLIGTS